MLRALAAALISVALFAAPPAAQDLENALAGVVVQLSPPAADEVRGDQAEWMKWVRKVCSAGDAARCLETRYKEQINLLTRGIIHAGSLTFFPRVHVMTAPDTAKPLPRSVDPGFGAGYFAWPEIDSPTPDLQKWNDAVRRQVIRMSVEVNDGNPPPVEFEPKTIADSDVSVTYALKAANLHFISVEFTWSGYTYGAAHPNEYVLNFNWWVDRARPLEAADIFRIPTNWQTLLADAAWRQLTSGARARYLYPANEARPAIAAQIKSINNWSLDSSGLTIEFPEYSVAPRYAGKFTARFTWPDLKPFLSPEFDPAALPDPL